MAVTETKVGELEFLTLRYHRLVESTMKTNQIIHTTFYISVVALGGLASVAPSLGNFAARGSLYVVTSVLFLAMLGLTKTYINSRKVLEHQMAALVEDIKRNDYDLDNLTAGDYFSKSSEYDQDSWESKKDYALLSYYAAVAILFIGVLVADFLLTVQGTTITSCIPAAAV